MNEPGGRFEALELIVLPLTRCNATCEYCFIQPDSATMTLGDVTNLLVRLREYAASRPTLDRVGLNWQGGEVLLLGTSWWRTVEETSRRIFDEIDLKVCHSLQSNLLAYESSWAPVVHELFNGNIGSSLDFPNLLRRTGQLDPEAFEGEWHERFLMARSDGLQVGVIALLTPETVTAGARRFYDHMFEELEIRQVQLNLPFPAAHSRRFGRSPTTPQSSAETAAFIRELFEVWMAEGRDRGHILRPFSVILDHLSGRRDVALPCIFAANCAEAFCAIAPDGQAALCDCWVTAYPSFHMGNAFRDPMAGLLRDNPVRDRFYARTEHLLRTDECGSCRHVAVCFGGCPVRTYSMLGTLDARDPYCEIYRAMFAAVEGSL